MTREGRGGRPAPSRESIEGVAETSERGVATVSSIEMEALMQERRNRSPEGGWVMRQVVWGRRGGSSCESGGQQITGKDAGCQPYEARGKSFFLLSAVKIKRKDIKKIIQISK